MVLDENFNLVNEMTLPADITNNYYFSDDEVYLNAKLPNDSLDSYIKFYKIDLKIK